MPPAMLDFLAAHAACDFRVHTGGTLCRLTPCQQACPAVPTTAGAAPCFGSCNRKRNLPDFAPCCDASECKSRKCSLLNPDALYASKVCGCSGGRHKDVLAPAGRPRPCCSAVSMFFTCVSSCCIRQGLGRQHPSGWLPKPACKHAPQLPGGTTHAHIMPCPACPALPFLSYSGRVLPQLQPRRHRQHLGLLPAPRRQPR